MGKEFVRGMGHVAVTVIDGDEHVLNPYNGSCVKKMEKRGNSAFYYVSFANSMWVFGIYKDLMPLDIPDEASQKQLLMSPFLNDKINNQLAQYEIDNDVALLVISTHNKIRQPNYMLAPSARNSIE